MPSVAKGFAWFVRVTLSHELLREKYQIMSSWIDLERVLFIGHIGNKTEKEHGHMLVILRSELQKQSLDVRIKNLFCVKGADYSSKPWDLGDGAGGYMFHDTEYCILGNKGFTDEVIERYKQLNKKTQEVIAVNKEKGANKNVEAVLEKFRGEKPTRIEIGTEILRRVKEGLMYDPGDWKLKSLIEEVTIRLCETEEEFERYAYSRLNNLFR
jgi:hypothetical protein